MKKSTTRLLGIEPVTDTLRRGRLRCAVHVDFHWAEPWDVKRPHVTGHAKGKTKRGYSVVVELDAYYFPALGGGEWYLFEEDFIARTVSRKAPVLAATKEHSTEANLRAALLPHLPFLSWVPHTVVFLGSKRINLSGTYYHSPQGVILNVADDAQRLYKLTLLLDAEPQGERVGA